MKTLKQPHSGITNCKFCGKKIVFLPVRNIKRNYAPFNVDSDEQVTDVCHFDTCLFGDKYKIDTGNTVWRPIIPKWDEGKGHQRLDTFFGNKKRRK